MIRLLDIITSEELQRLQKALIGATKIRSCILNLDSTPLSVSEPNSAFCSLMRSSPATCVTCNETDATLGQQAKQTLKPVIHCCRNLGVITACAPIIIEGEHIANWMLGQVVRKRLPESAVREFARKKNLPEKELLAAYQDLPVLKKKEFQKSLVFLGVFADMISEKAYKNYLLQKADAGKARLLSMLNVIMNNVESIIYVNDPQTYKLAYANEYVRQLTGTEKLEGRLCHEIFHGRRDPCPTCPLPQLFDVDGNPTDAVLHTHVRNEHLGRDFLVTDRLIPWYDGRMMHLEVAADITERKALATANAENIAKRQFLARMSHELRTPMNGVLGMTHLALAADPSANQREYLKKIQSSATLLLGIINDILDFSRIEAGKLTLDPQPFNVYATIAAATELVLPTAKAKELALDIIVGPEVPEFATGDSIRISQIILNLLGNAVKFTQTGTVSLTVNTETLSPEKLRLHCSVKDSGIGIPAEALPSLFAPFNQASASVTRQFGGTGLGLPICKMLVEIMHGEIVVTSQPGQGSTFYFHIELEPLQGDPPPSICSVQTSRRHEFEGKRILVVEDNAINQEIVASLLQDMKISVDLAENGEQAVSAFMANDYDLIFMDVRMPVLDGLEATRRIRKAEKHDAKNISIVAMTANAMAEDKKACSDAGMNGHVAKPIMIEELTATLDAHFSLPQAAGGM